MKFYRKFIAVLLLVGILINCFNYWIVSTSYSFNKKYISTVLCNNKSHPELHCEGKCILHIKQKELEQKTKHEQDNMKRMAETLAPHSGSLLMPVYEIVNTNHKIGYLQKKPTKAIAAIFQPPKEA
jgi:hypothetical protein